jgi:hypothetical protein
MTSFVSLSKSVAILFVLALGVFNAQGLSASGQLDESPDKVKRQDAFPRLHFDETTFDFGTVYQNQTLKHTFIFRNIGADVLHIYKVKAG